MKNKTNSTQKRTISVCLPLTEAEYVDAQATAVGLNKSDYIRSRLIFDVPVENTDKIDELIDALAIQNGKIDRLRLAVLNLSADVENLETSEYLHEYWGVMVRLSYLQDQLFELLKQLTNDVSKIRRRICKV